MSQKLKGNTKGLPPYALKRLKKLYDRAIDRKELVPSQLAIEVVEIADSIGRRVGLLVNREGKVTEVIVGTREILYLPDLGRYRLGTGRLRRLRLIFSDLSRSSEPVIPTDIYTDLEKLRFDAVIAVKMGAGGVALSYAYNLPLSKDGEGQPSTQTEIVPHLGNFNLDFISFIEDLESRHESLIGSEGELKNSALLVGVYDKNFAQAESSMDELVELAKTAGVQILDTVIQRRKPDPRTLLGKGKLEEVILHSLRLGAEMLIFDTELVGSQWRTITNATSLKVLDRSMLILDIFASRARTHDGRLQVELAQLRYNLPRLVEKDAGLSRLTGGIGGRGPGETKLEIGRRRMRDRIRDLEKRIDKLGSQRNLRRSRQRLSGEPVVALVGYTNVGKSTLFNALTREEVLVENKLFATLDTTKRALTIPVHDEESYRNVKLLLTDTVGFIRDLPKELRNAFRATLEELREADVLLHIVDASDRAFPEHIKAVREVFSELELGGIPELLVLNKVDRMEPEEVLSLQREYDALAISAVERVGFEELKMTLVGVLERSVSREGDSIGVG